MQAFLSHASRNYFERVILIRLEIDGLAPKHYKRYRSGMHVDNAIHSKHSYTMIHMYANISIKPIVKLAILPRSTDVKLRNVIFQG